MFSLVFYRNVLKGQDEGKTPMIQIDPTFERVARERGRSLEAVRELVRRYTELPDLGVLGEPRVNVLLLNLALDSM